MHAALLPELSSWLMMRMHLAFYKQDPTIDSSEMQGCQIEDQAFVFDSFCLNQAATTVRWGQTATLVGRAQSTPQEHSQQTCFKAGNGCRQPLLWSAPILKLQHIQLWHDPQGV